MIKDDISFDVDKIEEQKAKDRASSKKWKKKRYFELKAALIKDLGSKCVMCDSEFELEFHHTNNRDWSPNKMGRIQRLKRYRAEWEANKKSIVLLCKTCNTSDGAFRRWAQVNDR